MPMIAAALLAILVGMLVSSIAQFLGLPTPAGVAIAVGMALLCVWLFWRGGASLATVLARGLLVTALILGVILILGFTASGSWAPAVAGGLVAAAVGYFAASHFARREPAVPPPAPPAPPPAL